MTTRHRRRPIGQVAFVVSIRLDGPLFDLLDIAAKVTDMSRGDYLRSALEDWTLGLVPVNDTALECWKAWRFAKDHEHALNRDAFIQHWMKNRNAKGEEDEPTYAPR